MKAGDKVWLVGTQLRDLWPVRDDARLGMSRFVLVEGVVHGISEGQVTVNTRPNCRSAMLVSLPSEKVYETREAAELRKAQCEEGAPR